MNEYFALIYLGIISIISGLMFAYDKNAAKNSRRRIPERTLHVLEILGGVFCNLLLMYILHHKNRKFSYWALTWIIGIAWGVFIWWKF